MKAHAVATTEEVKSFSEDDFAKYEKLDEAYFKRRESWVGKLEDIFVWPIRRFGIRLSEVPGNLKDFYWRGKRGYADSDAWGIDSYLSSFMPEILRKMAEDKIGYPGDADDPNVDTPEHWKQTLEKIAKGFEAVRQQDEIEFKDIKQYKQEWDKLEKTRIEGMQLFTKYYNHLWD